MNKTQKLSLSAILLAIALALPSITMQIPSIGKMLSPMHLPVLIAGFIVGPVNALIIGILAPILRGAIFSIPPFPNSMYMAFEIGTYGLVAGLLFKKKYNYLHIYSCLLPSMFIGRVVYGLVKYVYITFILKANAYTIAIWLTDTITMSIPGIVIQLVLIPLLIMSLHKKNLLK